jgi:hypothetical protein
MPAFQQHSTNAVISIVCTDISHLAVRRGTWPSCPDKPNLTDEVAAWAKRRNKDHERDGQFVADGASVRSTGQ